MDQTVSFPEHWAQPAELAQALPREMRITGLGIFKVAFSILVVIGAVVLFNLMEREGSDLVARNKALREQGEQTTGEITQLWHQDRARIPMLAYAFTAKGVRFHGAAEVPKGLWDRIRVAGMLPIRYLPSDPNINHPAEWVETGAGSWFPFIFCPLLLLSAAFFAFNVQKQGKLLANGLPAPAVITRCYRVKGGWAATYQFRTKDGAVLGGRCSVTRKLEKGAVISVLYDPEKPTRNRVYPMDAYRVA